MRNNETGEFELVVGNKQLLSGFFIVVLLFAVAFAMGYVVGQNSPRSAKLASDGTSMAPVTSTADARPQPSTPPPPTPVSTPPATGEQPPADAAAPVTHPAEAAEAAPAAPQKATETVNTPTPASGVTPPDQLPPGNYWQVIAIKAEVSEAMRQTLKNKGFQVSLTPGINNLTRVLVGPYADAQAMGRAKTELEKEGFNPVRYKRD